MAILGWMAFARFAIPQGARRTWYWAAALWAVNPVAVILERKIWQPSITPIFVIAFIAAWWHRASFVPAFLWGALGAMIGQAYTACWLLTLAVLIWTLLYDRRSVHWSAWFVGNVVAGWPAIPWLLEILSAGPSSGAFVWRDLKLHYYLRWVTQPFGFGVDYTLGPNHTPDFLVGPVIAGHQSYLMAAAYAAAAMLLVIVAALAAMKLVKTAHLDARTIFIGNDQVGVLLRAAFWGYGGLLTLLTVVGLDSHRHYLIAIAPLVALWAVRFVEWTFEARTRAAAVVLAASVACQAVLSSGLISYIHATQIIRGEFGPTWRSQQP